MSVPHGVGKSRGDQVDQDWQRSHVTVLVLIASVSQEHLCRFPDIAAFSCSCKGPHQKSAFTCSSLVFHVFTEGQLLAALCLPSDLFLYAASFGCRTTNPASSRNLLKTFHREQVSVWLHPQHPLLPCPPPSLVAGLNRI